MSTASLSMNNPLISISFSRMNEATRKIERAQEEARCEAESLSRAIGSLQVSDGRLRMKGEALSSMRSRISRRQSGLQVMGAHIDYALRRFQEVDNLCAQRIKSNGYEYGRLLGTSVQCGIYANIVSGLNSIIDRGKAAWDYVKTNGNRILDCVQTGLDIVGLIPGLGEIADGINAGICLLRGDYAGATLSLAAMIPIAGCAATAGKFIYKGVKAYKQGKNIVKAIDRTEDIYGIVKKAGNKGIQKVASATGSLFENASRAFGKNPALAVEGAGAIRGSIQGLGIGIFKAEETAVQKSFKEIYKDSCAVTGKIEEVAAEAIENATNAMSHMAINRLHSFMDDLGIFLKREAMDMPEFTISRMTPPEMLSTDDILKLKRIRDAITVTDDTLCAKILPKSAANKYECNLIDSTFDCRTVRGYITRAEDTKGLNTYQDYYDTVRLDYNGTEFHPVRDDYISIMYFKTENTNAIKIPYGGVSDADLIAFSDATGLPRSELVKQQWPFTGNGFTASEGSKTLPEFTTKAGMGLDINNGEGAIYRRYSDGKEKLSAVFVDGEWIKLLD